MKAYGGFIMAWHKGRSATRPLVVGAQNFSDALAYARDSAIQNLPASEGYTNHAYDVVELKGGVLVEEEQSE